jgi:hypothetical protein
LRVAYCVLNATYFVLCITFTTGHF